MKKSEQAKTPEPENEDEVDRISNLPDPILQSILSRLQSTEETIRTSILSTRWRYLWTSVPTIDIDCTRRPQKNFDSNGFKEFVYWVLLNKPLDLDSFRLQCMDLYNMLTIRQWIYSAVMRKVKLLDLIFCPNEESEVDIEVPHCLVTCGSLEVLKLCLHGWRLCCPKSITGGFQALRVLEFREVDLTREVEVDLTDDDNLVNYFLENCPLLEDLSLIDCSSRSRTISSPNLKKLRIETRKLVGGDEEDDDEDDDVEYAWTCMALGICCPKLEFLKLRGYVACAIIFDNLHSLKKAVIHPKNMFVVEEPACNLLYDISHVESLSINLYCIKQCFDPEVDAPISLPNLKTLEIRVNGSMNMDDPLIPFLNCLPDLESLHLIIPKNMNRWNLEEGETMSILTRHLKKVEFLDFNEKKPKLILARLLLGHGDALEEMVFSWGDETKFHQRSIKTMKKVSNFYKASSTVKLTAVFNPTQS